MSSVIWNPIIYFLLNETFRRHFKSLQMVLTRIQKCFRRSLSCCSLAQTSCDNKNNNTLANAEMHLHANNRSDSGDSGKSNLPDNESPIATESGLTFANGKKKRSSKKLPELTVEITTLDTSEYDGC